jgi:hypothetical protein
MGENSSNFSQQIAMKLRVPRITFALLPLALAACADPVSLALSSANVVTAIDSGKTAADHAMSFATGDDCSFLHSIKGRSWCQPIAGETPKPPNQVCYSSIANMTCYPVKTLMRRTVGAPTSKLCARLDTSGKIMKTLSCVTYR